MKQKITTYGVIAMVAGVVLVLSTMEAKSGRWAIIGGVLILAGVVVSGYGMIKSDSPSSQTSTH